MTTDDRNARAREKAHGLLRMDWSNWAACEAMAPAGHRGAGEPLHHEACDAITAALLEFAGEERTDEADRLKAASAFVAEQALATIGKAEADHDAALARADKAEADRNAAMANWHEEQAATTAAIARAEAAERERDEARAEVAKLLNWLRGADAERRAEREYFERRLHAETAGLRAQNERFVALLARKAALEPGPPIIIQSDARRASPTASRQILGPFDRGDPTNCEHQWEQHLWEAGSRYCPLCGMSEAMPPESQQSREGAAEPESTGAVPEQSGGLFTPPPPSEVKCDGSGLVDGADGKTRDCPGCTECKSQHVYTSLPPNVRGPDRWSVWQCERCKTERSHASKTGAAWYRSPDGEWRQEFVSCVAKEGT